MTIRSPKHHDRGYTLVEMLVVIAIVGIVMGIATPSLLSLNKPLRDGTSQFKTQLNLIRSKAISSGQAYRLRPKYLTTAAYTGGNYPGNPHNFIVEYAANCSVTKYGSGVSGNPSYPDGWQIASQFDLDLPESVGVINDTTLSTVGSTSRNFPRASEVVTPPATPAPNASTAATYLNWEICYDNRGLSSQSNTIVLKDLQGNNRAKSAIIRITGVGQVTIETRDSANSSLNTLATDPIF